MALTNGDSEIQRIFDEKGETGKNINNNNTEKSNGLWHEEWEKSFNAAPLNVIPRKLEQDELEYVLRLYRLDEL